MHTQPFPYQGHHKIRGTLHPSACHSSGNDLNRLTKPRPIKGIHQETLGREEEMALERII